MVCSFYSGVTEGLEKREFDAAAVRENSELSIDMPVSEAGIVSTDLLYVPVESVSSFLFWNFHFGNLFLQIRVVHKHRYRACTPTLSYTTFSSESIFGG
jgi:hypothetical protein